jgi:hypothetical protein
MLFRMLLDEATGTVSYLLTQAETGDAVVIDPRAADVPVIRAMLAEQRAQLRWCCAPMPMTPSARPPSRRRSTSWGPLGAAAPAGPAAAAAG